MPNDVHTTCVKMEYMKFVYTTACISDIRILDIKVADVLMMNLVAVATTTAIAAVLIERLCGAWLMMKKEGLLKAGF